MAAGVGVPVGVGVGVGVSVVVASEWAEDRLDSDQSRLNKDGPLPETSMVTEAEEEQYDVQMAFDDEMDTRLTQVPAPSAWSTTVAKPADPGAGYGFNEPTLMVPWLASTSEHGPLGLSSTTTSNAVPGPLFHQATVKVMSSPTAAEDDSALLFIPTSGAGVGVLVGVARSEWRWWSACWSPGTVGVGVRSPCWSPWACRARGRARRRGGDGRRMRGRGGVGRRGGSPELACPTAWACK